MKKIITLILIISIIFFISSCSKQELIKNTKYYKSEKVQTWNIDLENEFIWYIESEIKTEIWTKQWWKINEIYVKEWDFVQAWDIIAKLDNSENTENLKNQELMLFQMQNLKNSVSNSFDSQIEVTKSLKNQANINLDWTKQILDLTKWMKEKELWALKSQIDTSKNALEAAQIELEQTKIVLKTKEENLYSNWKNAITSSMIVDTNTIKFVDSLLWVVNMDKNNTNSSLKTFLWAKDSNQKNQVLIDFQDIYKKYLDYKSIYESSILNKDASKEEIKVVLKIWIDFNDSLRNFLKDFYETIDNSIANWNDFSENSINLYKQKVSDLWTNIEGILISLSWDNTLWLKWISQWIENFNSEKTKTLNLLEKKIDLADNLVQTAIKNYEQVNMWNDIKISDVEINKLQANEKLNEIEKNKESLISSKTAKLSELNLENQKILLNKDLSIVAINNSIIRSPIDWIITKKFVEIWTVIVPSIAIVEISNKEKLKVVFEVTDTILSSIKLWDKIDLSIEWNEKLSKWIIKTISPTKNEITKKTKIEISLLDSKNLKIWSQAKIITKNQIKSWIIIPNQSILWNYLIPWVYVIEDKKIVFKNIKILTQNDDFSQIDWLEIWEEIITDWKENLFDWEELELNAKK